MPRNSQGLWVSKEELEQEEKQSGKKTNKSFLGVSFKEDLTSKDYQRILIKQNQAIIQLLSVQVSNVVQGVFTGDINKNYKKAIDKYTLD